MFDLIYGSNFNDKFCVQNVIKTVQMLQKKTAKVHIMNSNFLDPKLWSVPTDLQNGATKDVNKIISFNIEANHIALTQII